KVNCAAIPENLIESEFFGHEKGAFTGAVNKREGRFELAHGGTILLDEVSEISPQVQAKLLRVLQERELERVGGTRTIKVDVRVLATTNRHLEQSIERKEFRQDLFFRLNVVPILVPPLRERREDINFLAEQFMKRFARKHGVHVTGISPSCVGALQAHDWPGNVRELQNVIERAVILCGDAEDLQVEHLGFARSGSPTPVSAPVTNPVGSPATPAETTDEVLPLAELEKRQILLALDRCKGNRTHAARKLGISIRTLRNKLHEYGVSSKEEPIEEEKAE
ncbi:MAG: sigma-54 dependent transcriptional regulator, partial [Verrucomicrobiota bacterium]